MEITCEILNIINVVRDYKQFIISQNYVKPKPDFDWFKETEKYYHSLPLPEGMKANRHDFERILYFDTRLLQKLNNTNYDDKKNKEGYICF